MKRLILWFTLFCVAATAAPVGPIAANRRRTGSTPPTLIVHGGYALGFDGGTTSSLNTTGSNFIVASISYYQPSSATLSDSKSNTWTALTARENSASSAARLFYCYNPTVGTGHTFTVSQSTSISSVYISAWSGIASSPFDVENGAITTGGTTLATGSVTPSQGSVLLIASENMSAPGASTTSIDNSFTVTDALYVLGGDHYGGAMAYKILSSVSATNPTWTVNTTMTTGAATIASFKY